MQKRQSQSTNRSRSEKFNPHPEEVASGFPIDPPRPSSQAFEPNRESQGNIIIPHKRASHSGPLSRRSASAKGRRNYQDPQKVSSVAADYSAMPGFAAIRTGAPQQETCRGMTRLPGSFKETSEEANQEENGRNNKKDPILVSPLNNLLCYFQKLPTKVTILRNYFCFVSVCSWVMDQKDTRFIIQDHWWFHQETWIRC